MKKDKVFIEGYVVGSFADTLGTQGKQIHIASGDIVEIDDNFIYKSIEPEKVKVPQFVADWIEEARKTCKDVADFFDFNFTNEEVGKWFMQEQPFDLVARAWLDGYEVEKERKYEITLLNRNDGDLYLVNQNANLGDKYGHFSPVVLLFTKSTFFSEKCYKLTKKEVVSNGFGWVFDCPGIKVKEVE